MHASGEPFRRSAAVNCPVEDGVLGVATTSGVEGVAVLRVAEPLRRAALAGFDLRIAPQAGWLDRSGGDQRRVPVHNVLLNLRQPPSGGIVPDCRRAVSGLPPVQRDDLTQVTRVTISPV